MYAKRGYCWGSGLEKIDLTADIKEFDRLIGQLFHAPCTESCRAEAYGGTGILTMPCMLDLIGRTNYK